MFDLSYRDITLLLGQTLSPAEKQIVLRNAREFGDQVYITVAQGFQEEKRKNCLPGEEAVPPMDSNWNADFEAWKIRHCQVCIIEGLRQSKTKL